MSSAGRIVRRFKEDTIRIIEEEPERLAEVKGISEKKAREIAEQVEGKKEMRNAMIYLQKYGISTTLAAKIYKKYKDGVYRVLEENPYRLADDIQGVGFRRQTRLLCVSVFIQTRISVFVVEFSCAHTECGGRSHLSPERRIVEKIGRDFGS